MSDGLGPPVEPLRVDALDEAACAALAAALTARIQPHLRAARIGPVELPDCAGLRLFLLNADFPHDALSPEEMDWALNEPSYWLFCWASGLAQARRILARPELVRGKSVLDFGTGSGVVAVAAALAGARRVVACDIDPVSLEATAANAALNGVTLELAGGFFTIEERFDLLFGADVLYDVANRSFLPAFLDRADEVWLADSRVKDLSAENYQHIEAVDAGTLPDLNEFDEFRRVSFYHGQRTPAPAPVPLPELPPPSPVTPADRLAFTLVVALLLHALVVFGIRFLPPSTRAAPMLEVTLVPAESANAPRRADFLAQAQQEGSGSEAEARLLTSRERTPLPGRSEVSHPPRPSQRQPEPRTAEARRITASESPEHVAAARPQAVPEPAPPAPSDNMDAEIAALEARLSANRQAYARRPRVRTLAAVSARADEWAGYVEHFRERVELTGNANYPAEARASHLQGQVRLLVALSQDGRVQRIQVLSSSGQRVLDQAAQQSVRDAQPFGRFPAGLSDEVDVLQIIRTWRFAEGLATSSQ